MYRIKEEIVMSFMFKPLAYDEPNAVNKIQLKDDVRQNFIRGMKLSLKR